MSLIKNGAGQNVAFALINSLNDAALTGLGSGVTVKVSKDGAAQTAGVGTITELGNGVYNYAPTQSETNGNCVSFLLTATNALPTNLMFLTGGLHKNIASQHITFGLYTT